MPDFLEPPNSQGCEAPGLASRRSVEMRDARQPFANGEVLLRSSSYTALLLYHNSPRTMHVESRVLVIGHISLEWMKQFQTKSLDRFYKVLKQKTLASIGPSNVLDLQTMAELADFSNLRSIARKQKYSIRRFARRHRASQLAQLSLKRTLLLERIMAKTPSQLPFRRKSLSEEQLLPQDARNPEECGHELKIEDPAFITSSARKENIDDPPVAAPSTARELPTALSPLTDPSSESLISQNSTESFQTVNTSFGSGQLGSRKPREKIYPDVAAKCSISELQNIVLSANEEEQEQKPQQQMDPRPPVAQLAPRLLQQGRVRLRPLYRLQSSNALLNAISHVDRRGRKYHLRNILVKKRGEIVFQGRFLVQIRESTRYGLDFQETSYAPPPLVETWKEYAVVLRLTGNPDAPIAMYFYSISSVKKLQRRIAHRWSRSLKFKLVLDNTCKLGIYSFLDFSTVLWSVRPGSRKMRMFIFKAQSMNTIMMWLFVVSTALGKSVINPLRVVLPQLKLQVVLPPPNPKKWAQKMTRNFVTYEEITSPTSSRSKLVQYIMDQAWKAVKPLRRTCVFDSNEMLKFALCWRRLDRLHWLLDECDLHILTSWLLSKTQDLEMRNEYPTTRRLDLDDGGKMSEPIAVEGYCYRLNSWTGKAVKQFANRVYLHSHDNLLFMSSPQQIEPPLILNPDGTLPRREDYANRLQELPSTYAIMPYEPDATGNIAWIRDCKDLRDVDFHDAYAYFERRRRGRIINTAESFIDLARIEGVQKIDTNIFEIRYPSGHHLCLKVESGVVCDVWLERLAALHSYWHARIQQDALRARILHNHNLRTNLAETELSWGQSSIIADPLIFTNNVVTLSRSIIYAGFLYAKRRRMASFHSYFAVLTSTHLCFYKAVDPQLNGNCVFRTAHLVDLQDKYLCSGQLAAEWIQSRDEYSDPQNPGFKALPRVYDDGWRSADPEVDRYFVLLSAKEPGDNLPLLDMFHRNSVCLSRSRYERDVWVNALNYVLTSVARKKDAEPAISVDELKD